MAHVFISYSHKDTEYAHTLAEELERWGIEAWIDDERIDYGSPWPRVIQENLDACPGFIVIMSSNSYNSDWVLNEVSYAQANKKEMFPLLLDGKAWVSFAAKQYADVRNGEMPPNKYFETIRKKLESYEILAKPEYELPKTPKLSAAQQLSEQIVDHIMDSVKNSSSNSWEIGMFHVSHLVPRKNPPKWVITQQYILSSKIVNTNLLQRYDEETYQDYIRNEERIAQKEQSTSGHGTLKNLGETAQEHIRLRERLNLQVFMSSQFEFSEIDVRKFVKKLMDVHEAHNIPVSEIKVKFIK